MHIVPDRHTQGKQIVLHSHVTSCGNARQDACMETFGQRVKRLRMAQRMSQGKLAKALGFADHSRVSKMESGEATPALLPEKIAVLAKMLNVSIAYLLTGGDTAQPSVAPVKTFEADDFKGDMRNGVRHHKDAPMSPAPGVRVPIPQEMPRDMPVRGVAACSSGDGAFQFEMDVVDWVRRPPALVGVAEAYALYMSGDSMEPKYKDGDLVFVHPKRPVRPGDDVIIVMCDGPNGEPYAYCKTIVEMRPEVLTIRQYNPPITRELDRGLVVSIHRVMTNNDMYG